MVAIHGESFATEQPESMTLTEPPSNDVVKSIVQAIENDRQLLLQDHERAKWDVQDNLKGIAMKLYGRKGRGDVHLFTRVAVALYDEESSDTVMEQVTDNHAHQIERLIG